MPSYVSTRADAPVLGFEDAMLAGLARDGGLYVPATVPTLDVAAIKGAAYTDLAKQVMAPFIGDAVSDADLTSIIKAAYATFESDTVTPLVQIADKHFLMELFHGPSLAFKDIAMQMLARLFDHALTRRGERVTIVGATSGDTGAAAMAACANRAAVDVFILYPEGRVSEVQQRQMTTIDAPNVHAIAVQGNFDDCQDLVKAMFNDLAFRDQYRLSAVNSINWARVMAQIVYYLVPAATGMGPVRFCVPTGNFGNVLAGSYAKQMGVNIPGLIVASNANDILTRFLNTGVMESRNVVKTLSPSMDIQVSSNFERLLFDLLGRDGHRVASTLKSFRETGMFTVDDAAMVKVRETFTGARFDDAETSTIIRNVHAATGYVLDPHTAVGVGAAQAHVDEAETPIVTLATAHPAKFPDAVEAVTGTRPALPPHLADLYERTERMTTLPAEIKPIQNFIAAELHQSGAA